MPGEKQELQVQKDEKEIKNAVKSDQKKLVEAFTDALKTAQKNKKEKEPVKQDKNKDQSTDKDPNAKKDQKPKGKEEKPNKDAQKIIDENNQSKEDLIREQNIRKVFLEGVPEDSDTKQIEGASAIVSWMTENLKGNINKIDRIKGAKDLQVFKDAKQAFEIDTKSFKGETQGEIDALKALSKKLNELQSYIDLKEIQSDANYINTMSKEAVFKYVDKTVTPIKINSTYEKEITQLDNQIPGKIGEVSKSILNAVNGINQKKAFNTNELLNLTDTRENAKSLFETGSEANFNTMFEAALKDAKDNKLDIVTHKNLQELLKAYAKADSISDIKIGTAVELKKAEFPDVTKMFTFKAGNEIKKESSMSMNGAKFTNNKEGKLTIDVGSKKYECDKTGTILTELDQDGKATGATTTVESIFGGQVTIASTTEGYTINAEKIVVRGTQAHMQELKTDKSGEAETVAITEKIDRTKDNALQAFDGKGNYKKFQKYLEQPAKDNKPSGLELLSKNMNNIAKNIINYSPDPKSSDASENLDELRNGYCKVLCDFIIAHKGETSLVNSYLGQIGEGGDRRVLGTSADIQLQNAQALQNAGIDIKSAFNFDKIKESAFNKTKNTLEARFKTLLDLLTSLGIVSKSTLKKRGLGDKFNAEVDKYFQEKYKIPKDKMKIIEGISGKGTDDKFDKGTYVTSFKTIDAKYIDVNMAEYYLDKAGAKKNDFIKYSGDKKEIIADKKEAMIDAMFIENNREEIESTTNSQWKSAKKDVDEERLAVNKKGESVGGNQREMPTYDATIQSKVISIYLTDLGIKKDMQFVIAENFSQETKVGNTETPPEQIAKNLGVEYDGAIYTYAHPDGTKEALSLKNPATKPTEADIKAQKEQVIKDDLMKINNNVTYDEKSFKYIFLKDEQGPTPYSILSENLTNKDYGKILTQANILLFLKGTKEGNAQSKLFDFSDKSAAQTALDNISKMKDPDSFKVEKDADGNIKISGKESSDKDATVLSFTLQADLDNFKVANAQDIEIANKKAQDIEIANKKAQEEKELVEKELKAITDINGATLTTMDGVIVANATTLGLEMNIYNNELKDKTPVRNALLEKKFTEKKAIQTAFNEAVLDQRVIEINKMAVKDIVDTKDEKAMEEMITKYAAILELDVVKDSAYDKLSNKMAVSKELFNKKSTLTDEKIIQKAFNEAVTAEQEAEDKKVEEDKKTADALVEAEKNAINSITGATDVIVMDAAIRASTEALKLDLTNYNGLTNKQSIRDAVNGKTFNKGSEFKTAFEKVALEEKAKQDAATQKVNGQDQSTQGSGTGEGGATNPSGQPGDLVNNEKTPDIQMNGGENTENIDIDNFAPVTEKSLTFPEGTTAELQTATTNIYREEIMKYNAIKDIYDEYEKQHNVGGKEEKFATFKASINNILADQLHTIKLYENPQTIIVAKTGEGTITPTEAEAKKSMRTIIDAFGNKLLDAQQQKDKLNNQAGQNGEDLVKIMEAKEKQKENNQDYSINSIINSKNLTKENKEKFNISDEALNKMKEYELDVYPSKNDENGKIAELEMGLFPSSKMTKLSLQGLKEINASVDLNGILKIIIDYEGHIETTEIQPNGGEATVTGDDGKTIKYIRDAQKNRRNDEYYSITPSIARDYGGKYDSKNKTGS